MSELDKYKTGPDAMHPLPTGMVCGVVKPKPGLCRSVVYISKDVIASLLCPRIAEGGGIAIPMIGGLPCDAKVIDVSWCPEQEAFACVVESIWFDPVSIGSQYPVLTLFATRRRVSLLDS